MPAIINHKICDNVSACGGIEVCPVGAFAYNEKTKKIEIDNNKCISCGACESTCPIGAIGVARTWAEYEELKKEIESDPRSAEDLFVDRYGGDIVDESVLIDGAAIESVTRGKDKILIELFEDDSIKCLLKSIPYSEILKASNATRYYKCQADEKMQKDYNINELPSLLLFSNEKFIKAIQGYFEEGQKEELFDQLRN